MGPRYATSDSASKLAGVRSSVSSCFTKSWMTGARAGLVTSCTEFLLLTRAKPRSEDSSFSLSAATVCSASTADIFRRTDIFLSGRGSPWTKSSASRAARLCSMQFRFAHDYIRKLSLLGEVHAALAGQVEDGQEDRYDLHASAAGREPL